MKKITTYEWHGSTLVLLCMAFLVITLPLAAVYIVENFETTQVEVPD